MKANKRKSGRSSLSPNQQEFNFSFNHEMTDQKPVFHIQQIRSEHIQRIVKKNEETLSAELCNYAKKIGW